MSSGNNDELKECPFCGGKAAKKETENGGKYIYCRNCNASTALHFDRAENLNDAWNKRVNSNF